MSIHEGTSISGENMIDVFENKSGYGEYNGNTPQQATELIDSISMLIENRESAYTLAAPTSKDYRKVGSYDTEQEAQDDIENFQQRLVDNNLQYYASVTGVEKDDNSNL